MQKVAVIGAGAAGLCALRHLTARPTVFQAVAFEQTDRVGGTWVYTDDVGTDQYGLPVHSSMYKNMRINYGNGQNGKEHGDGEYFLYRLGRTNLPKEVMAFPDFPFPKDLPSFIRHEEVLEYLEAYAKKYELGNFIKTCVTEVKPLKDREPMQWQVSYRDVTFPDCAVVRDVFDGVMVCNGHYSTPLKPSIPGELDFTGPVIHSHCYRKPEVFRDMTVVCLGARSSGQDIALELAPLVKQVILSHSGLPIQSVLPANLIQAPGIKQLKENSAVFNDNSEKEIDALICCTGYRFTFPFLMEDCNLRIEDERLIPLYKHLIHTEYTSLSFLGMCKIICPFPLFHCQVLFALAVLDGSLKLPPKQEMDADMEADFQRRLEEGLPPRHAHNMGPRQWGYNDDLARIAQFEPIPTVVKSLYDEVHRNRHADLAGYKKVRYELTGSDAFRKLEQ